MFITGSSEICFLGCNYLPWNSARDPVVVLLMFMGMNALDILDESC